MFQGAEFILKLFILFDLFLFVVVTFDVFGRFRLDSSFLLDLLHLIAVGKKMRERKEGWKNVPEGQMLKKKVGIQDCQSCFLTQKPLQKFCTPHSSIHGTNVVNKQLTELA